MDDKIREALYKKSIGYDLTEIVEEYNGEGDILKRKVSTKFVPPDTSAIKMLMEEYSKDESLTRLTDEELKKEKMRLLRLLKESEDNEIS